MEGRTCGRAMELPSANLNYQNRPQKYNENYGQPNKIKKSAVDFIDKIFDTTRSRSFGEDSELFFNGKDHDDAERRKILINAIPPWIGGPRLQ